MSARQIVSISDLNALATGSAVQTSDTCDTVVLKGADGVFRNQDGGEVSARVLWDYGTKPFSAIYEPS